MIRQSESVDFSAIARLHAQCFRAGWDENAICRLLDSPGAAAFVACERDEIAGFILSRSAAGEAEIVSLGVSPGLRRRGIGAELVRAVCRRAFGAGVLEIFLEVAVTNAGARALYSGLKFREVGRRPNYYGEAEADSRDALILRRAMPL